MSCVTPQLVSLSLEICNKAAHLVTWLCITQRAVGSREGDWTGLGTSRKRALQLWNARDKSGLGLVQSAARL